VVFFWKKWHVLCSAYLALWVWSCPWSPGYLLQWNFKVSRGFISVPHQSTAVAYPYLSGPFIVCFTVHCLVNKVPYVATLLWSSLLDPFHLGGDFLVSPAARSWVEIIMPQFHARENKSC